MGCAVQILRRLLHNLLFVLLFWRQFFQFRSAVRTQPVACFPAIPNLSGSESKPQIRLITPLESLFHSPHLFEPPPPGGGPTHPKPTQNRLNPPEKKTSGQARTLLTHHPQGGDIQWPRSTHPLCPDTRHPVETFTLCWPCSLDEQAPTFPRGRSSAPRAECQPQGSALLEKNSTAGLGQGWGAPGRTEQCRRACMGS